MRYEKSHGQPLACLLALHHFLSIVWSGRVMCQEVFIRSLMMLPLKLRPELAQETGPSCLYMGPPRGGVCVGP